MTRKDDTGTPTFFMSRALAKYVNSVPTGDGVRALLMWSNVMQSHANLTGKEVHVVNFDSSLTVFRPV